MNDECVNDRNKSDWVDILRLVEAHPELAGRLPGDVAGRGKEG